jgi:hypothetical protein
MSRFRRAPSPTARKSSCPAEVRCHVNTRMDGGCASCLLGKCWCVDSLARSTAEWTYSDRALFLQIGSVDHPIGKTFVLPAAQSA